MIFFESEQVIKLHSSLIAKTGGMDGIRDENLLDSALKYYQTASKKVPFMLKQKLIIP